jgi:hypothetical protein
MDSCFRRNDKVWAFAGIWASPESEEKRQNWIPAFAGMTKQEAVVTHTTQKKPTLYFTTLRCGGFFTASSVLPVAGGGSGGALSAENIMPCPFSCA